MTFEADDRVLLFEAATGHRWLLLAGQGVLKEKGLGIVDTDKLTGAAPGDRVEYAGKALVLLRPTPADLARTLRRKAQIILPKDISRIVHELGLGPGDRVLESGMGSGAATIAMASAVGEAGRIVVQELRQDFADWATDNVQRAGLGGRIEVHLGDLTEGLAPEAKGAFDAVLLDQPEPWNALAHVVPALAPGARVAAYCPQVSQMERSHKAMVEAGFADVRSLELIQRDWTVKELGSRPAFEGLGHTAFLVFGRWLG